MDGRGLACRTRQFPCTDFRGKFGGPPFGLQSVTAKQLGEALRQVQEAVIQGVCEKMKALERQPGPMQGFEYESTPRYTPSYQQNGNHSLQA